MDQQNHAIGDHADTTGRLSDLLIYLRVCHRRLGTNDSAFLPICSCVLSAAMRVDPSATLGRRVESVRMQASILVRASASSKQAR